MIGAAWMAAMVIAQGGPVLRPVPARERLVGLAYTTWHRSRAWSGVWGEPELGFYISDDRAVIRQHARWIADAGVDFVWVDWSNDLGFHPGETKGRPDFEMIEGATRAMFEEYSKMPRHPKISIFIGCPGEPEAVKNGALQRKADQVWAEYGANPRFRPLLQEYLGKPLLVVYVNTPSPFQDGVPTWTDPRFTVRWMTGFITQQPNLRSADLVSRYGYWSWEDRGKQTYAVHGGRPEAMTIVAAWRDDPEAPTPGRRGGATFHAEWARANSIGPKFALVVSWNEWVLGEQPSAEVSKDLEPSRQHGRLYLRLLKEEVARFKGRR